MPVFVGYDVNNDNVLDTAEMGSENAVIPCMADDYFIYKADKSLYIKANGLTNDCDDGDGGPFPNSWELAANGEDFTLTNYKGKLLVVNDSTFKFYVFNENNEKMYYQYKR